jgi:hypothetical protein
MRGKYKRRKPGKNATPNSQRTTSAEVNQTMTVEEKSVPEPKKENEKVKASFIELIKTDLRFRIDLGALIVGFLVLVIYGCQLNQMIKSNEISRESLQSTQRADITFESITNRRGGNGPHGWKLGIRFENSGNTESVRTIDDPHLKALPDEPSDELFKVSNTDKFTEMPIGTKHPATTTTAPTNIAAIIKP